MAEIGRFNNLRVIKQLDFGVYLDGGEGEEILLPKRFVPKGVKDGDEIEVFLYHDSENRIIATTQKPKAIVDEIAMMEVVDTSKHGAFLDWGLMKDLFVPLSQQELRMQPGQYHLVRLYLDEQTGRIAATARISRFLSNHDLTVKENDSVELLVYQKTDIGYKVIINNKHLGVLHYNEVFRDLEIGDKEKGFIKTIREDNKIDVSLGERGYSRVEGEAEKILRLLKENDGYLPYHDKSDPEDIYDFFGMSKKTFKMTIGALYKQKQIELTQTGIKLLEE
ncbi:S1 RNA-binding domain-containing protein [Polluticoccus soli]|uniref:CvfB family protein n=1 Tax=Polluticoccus soli TaxID=3034150 RepID=UPI0023E2444E|nr:S1-like domain-containing RNA-binding protein [Flavipsychrobacter sp. JY13-12]